MDFDGVWPNMDRFSPNFVENTLIFDNLSTPTLAISVSDATGRALRSYTYIHSAILLRYEARCPKLPARYKARCPSLGTSRLAPVCSGSVPPAPNRNQPRPAAPNRTQPPPPELPKRAVCDRAMSIAARCSAPQRCRRSVENPRYRIREFTNSRSTAPGGPILI